TSLRDVQVKALAARGLGGPLRGPCPGFAGADALRCAPGIQGAGPLRGQAGQVLRTRPWGWW
ncbi:hypothetical protein ACTVZO_41760, partial [Streptomyces sp. IBSNAI002]|uniref:hypothetical protein n=1 Tax=Streptomyces sp. IBSNAI002 TaxID=3457500 RepID=UPI003FD22E2A